MKIKPKYLALSFAIISALFWSFYKLYAFLAINGNYTNLSGFNWFDYSNKFLLELSVVILSTGGLGWLVAEVYNDLEQFFKIRLK